MVTDSIQPLGALVHYDGIDWKYIDIPKIPMIFVHIKKLGSGKKYLLSATNIPLKMSTKFYSFEEGNLNEIFSTTENIFSLDEMAGEVYVIAGKQILKWRNNALQVWRTFPERKKISHLCGRSEADWFLITDEGITHNNGKNFEVLYRTSHVISDVLIFPKDIIMLSYNFDIEKTIIIHGKLKEGEE